MRRRFGLAALLFASVIARPALAVDVHRSIEVAAPPDDVWALIGEFCSISDWHPIIESCALEQEGNVTFRVLLTEEGGRLREQLMAISDAERYYRYSIIQSPLPVSGYVSTLSVEPGGDAGSALVVWVSQFAAVGMSDREAAGVIEGIYDAGLEQIRATFE